MTEDITLASGGVAAADEKVFLSSTRKFQRTVLASSDTWAPAIVSVSTVVDLIAANEARVFVRITPRDGDIYIGPAGALNNDASRVKVRQGETWETPYYVGLIRAVAVSSAVIVDIEEMR